MCSREGKNFGKNRGPLDKMEEQEMQKGGMAETSRRADHSMQRRKPEKGITWWSEKDGSVLAI